MLDASEVWRKMWVMFFFPSPGDVDVSDVMCEDEWCGGMWCMMWWHVMSDASDVSREMWVMSSGTWVM